MDLQSYADLLICMLRYGGAFIVILGVILGGIYVLVSIEDYVATRRIVSINTGGLVCSLSMVIVGLTAFIISF